LGGFGVKTGGGHTRPSQVFLHGKQCGVEAGKSIGASLNARGDKAEQFDVKVAIFF
jgi:hypothetical protein